MSQQKNCCCACSSGYKVFVPCNQTIDTVDVLAPILTLAQFATCGFSEGVVYLYDSPDCDPYCGTWKCRFDLDDTENHCYADTDCPECSDWNGTLVPPYRLVRASELAVFCTKFTTVEGGCCDDTVCPDVDCGYGQIIPGDCDVCYDAADLQWSAWIDWVQTQQAQETLEDAVCTPPVAVRTVDCNISIDQVQATITGTTLYLCFLFKATFTKNTSSNDCTIPTDAGWSCYPTCIPGDPGQDVLGTTWSTYFQREFAIPCMGTPGTSGAGTCPAEPGNPTMCGGIFTMPDGIANQGSNVLLAHAIGWTGNAEIYTAEFDISWAADLSGYCWGPKAGSTPQSGTGTYTVHIEAALPARPDDCP